MASFSLVSSDALSSPAEKQNMIGFLAAHYDIDAVKVFEPTLNDIFVEYAGDQQ